MSESFGARFKKAWNIFLNRDSEQSVQNYGVGYSESPYMYRGRPSHDRTIINSVFTRIAMDVAAVDIRHVKLDENDRFIEEFDSELNDRFSYEANLDQTGRVFFQDVVYSMLDEGVVAIVPVDTNDDIDTTTSYKILSMRTGKIVQWYPKHVQIDLYNDRTGNHELVTMAKSDVAIIRNPLYSVVNEANGTMQRLLRKLSLLDAVDEESGSGKMNLIIQLPYIVKTEARKQQAEQRRSDIERQLAEGKYGIAYTDGTERITQLNRPIENKLLEQVEYLTSMLYSQLGITQDILNGTADEEAMLSYYHRTVEPILSAITEEMERKFLTKTARSQRQSIRFFRDPFKLVSVTKLADIADTFTRNEILTSNEIRQIIGMKPSDDPNADILRNKNITPNESEARLNTGVSEEEEPVSPFSYGNGGKIQNE